MMIRDTADSNVNIYRLNLTDAERADIFVQWLSIVQALSSPSSAVEKIRVRFLEEIAEVRRQ